MEKTSSGRYKVRIWDKHLCKKVYVGTYPTKTAARTAGTQAELRLLTFGHLPEHKDITLVALCDRYIEMNPQLRTSTIDWYANALKKARAFFGDEASVRRMSKEDMQSYVSSLISQKKASKTVVGYLKALGAVFEQAVEWGYRESNPCRKLRNLPENRRADDAIRVLSTTEHARLADSAPGHYRTMVSVWPFIGLRRSEMQGLRWEDVDLVGGRLHVRHQLREDGSLDPNLKTRKSRRTIVMPQNVVNELRKWRLESKPNLLDLVFPTQQGLPQTSKPNFYSWWNKACAKAGLAGCNPHDMRHTFATWSLAAGENPKRVADEMGHEKTSMMLDTYLHLLVDDNVGGTKRLEEWYYSQAATSGMDASTAPIPPLKASNA
ncbi:MAG TPA: site-specific integrase [Coriobacteriia bacterium]|nr:site-specific integrase [Coriobacteriia bacterium]